MHLQEFYMQHSNRFTNIHLLKIIFSAFFTNIFVDVDITRLATKCPVFANQRYRQDFACCSSLQSGVRPNGWILTGAEYLLSLVSLASDNICGWPLIPTPRTCPIICLLDRLSSRNRFTWHINLILYVLFYLLKEPIIRCSTS